MTELLIVLGAMILATTGATVAAASLHSLGWRQALPMWAMLVTFSTATVLLIWFFPVPGRS